MASGIQGERAVVNTTSVAVVQDRNEHVSGILRGEEDGAARE